MRTIVSGGLRALKPVGEREGGEEGDGRERGGREGEGFQKVRHKEGKERGGREGAREERGGERREGKRKTGRKERGWRLEGIKREERGRKGDEEGDGGKTRQLERGQWEQGESGGRTEELTHLPLVVLGCLSQTGRTASALPCRRCSAPQTGFARCGCHGSSRGLDGSTPSVLQEGAHWGMMWGHLGGIYNTIQ